jgi:Protein of unknown function (DUF3383)
MASPLPISGLIAINLNLAAAPIAVPNFQTMLIIGPSTVIDVVQRFRSYANINAVAADFLTTSPEYQSALFWFSSLPTPQQLYIGRWAQAASAGQLVCGPLTATNSLIATWNLITNGGFKITVNGTLLTITGLNFSAAANLAAVAAIIQTALNTALSGTTCIYQASLNNFIITSPTTGPTSTATLLTAPGSGTDISATMSGTTATGAYVANGIAAETALAAVQIFDINFPSLYFGLFVASAAAADYTAIAAFIEAEGGAHWQGAATQDPNTLLLNNTTNLAFLLQASKYNWTVIQYSSQSAFAVVGLMARIMTVNWTQSNSAITLMYKQIQGLTAETLTSPQLQAILSYNCNVYINYSNNAGGSFPIIQPGIAPSGNFVDAIVGAAVLRGTMLTNLFNILASTNTKVSQTNQGQSLLEAGILQTMEQFVINGYCGPQVWDGPSFGNLANGQFVPKGYYIFQPPVTQQTPAARQSRVSVPFQVAAVLSGAVHTASVLLNVAA